MKIIIGCLVGGTSSAIIAQVMPSTSGSPWAVGTAAAIGIIGTAIAHFFQRLQSGAIRAEAQRLDAAVKGWEERYDQVRKDCEDRCQALERRATLAEAREMRWRTKYDILSGKRSSDDIDTVKE